MGVVYRNKREIPIPDGLHINHSDGRVYSLGKDASGNKKRMVFGYATSEKTMHVNDTFKLVYPDLWKLYYGEEELRPYFLHCGMYALCLGISQNNGLYQLVQKSFGPKNGNALMDYAMYSLLYRSDVTQLFGESMHEEVLFSDKVYSDSWYSELFRSKIDGNMIHAFKLSWLGQCRASGIRKAWIAIDGSNNNCQVSDSDLAERGKAKSKKNVDIVSYIYAVDARTGLPITYQINPGGMVDSKAFHLICMMLKDSGIDIEGVIVDRGFCTIDVVRMIKENGYEYVLMLKGNTYGHTSMMESYADDIRWAAKYCIGDEGLFGISEERQLFGNASEKAYISLIFDGVNGSARSVALIKQIRNCIRMLEDKIRHNEKASIPATMKKYLSIMEENGARKIVCDYSQWQKAMDTKGYHSLAASKDLGAEKVHEIYGLRDASETQYMILKTMEGFDVTRVHSDPSIQSKFALCFIASIIRSEIMSACKKCQYDTARMIKEIDRIQLLLRPDDRYHPIKNYTLRQKTLLEQFGISPSAFEQIADDLSSRNTSAIKSQERKIESTLDTYQAREQENDSTQTETTKTETKKRRGRPKGSLNKKTLERMEREKDNPPVPKRKRGRPKGSLNKKTIERLSKEGNTEQKPKRKPGRPKGSLNKKTIERMRREGRL